MLNSTNLAIKVQKFNLNESTLQKSTEINFPLIIE